ncbi:hypothetical protein ID866_9956 [Astraeus odoratus]|nr:hypothetical protein ID866_9956 [Astraeus odoratus]
MCLRIHTQTKCEDAEHFLSGSCQIPSASDHHPPLSAHCSSLTTPHASLSTPCHGPHIRTLAKELEDAKFRTPYSPRGSDPDPGDPDDPDDDDSDNDNNASNPSVKDNPILALTNAITCLSCTTRCRPKDSGAACTKVHEPNTFDGMDLKKLCEFLVQCKLNFHNRPQAFHSDAQKVSFSLSFLKGIALAWFKPDLLDTIPGAEPAWADDYSEFVIELTTNFGPHDPISNAEHQLDNLSMKDGSCINKYIGMRLCVGKPSHLVNLHTMAQGIDVCYWEHKSEIACQNKSNPQPSLSKQSNTSSGTSSLSSTGKGKNPQHPSFSTPKSSDSSAPDLSGVLGKDGKLTAMKHLHCIKNALCLFCGLPGHLAKDCPRSMSHTAKACATQAASIAASTAETPAEAKK